MEPLIDFRDLVTGLQRLPEREKIIVVALINAHGSPESGDAAKIERLVARPSSPRHRTNAPAANLQRSGLFRNPSRGCGKQRPRRALTTQSAFRRLLQSYPPRTSSVEPGPQPVREN